MELKKILAITGKPGLFKLVAQSRTGVIVESLEDGKRFPVMASQNVSTLGDIAIFTTEGELPLAEILRTIFTKQDGAAAISTKDSAEVQKYFGEIVPNFDRERVYASDMKKVINWYNMLQKHGLVDLEVEAAAETEETTAEATPAEESAK